MHLTLREPNIEKIRKSIGTLAACIFLMDSQSNHPLVAHVVGVSPEYPFSQLEIYVLQRSLGLNTTMVVRR